jgi:hypothetical protein
MNARLLVIGVVLLALAGAVASVLPSCSAARERAAAVAEWRAATAEATLTRERELRVRADVLTAQLAAAERDIHAALKERDDALQRATTGRPCLRADALRVLDGAPGLRVQPVPAAAAADARAHAAAAADPGLDRAAGAPAAEPAAGGLDARLEATDTQAAGWMLAAGAQYETCRARLHALIDHVSGAAAAGPPP